MLPHLGEAVLFANFPLKRGKNAFNQTPHSVRQGVWARDFFASQITPTPTGIATPDPFAVLRTNCPIRAERKHQASRAPFCSCRTKRPRLCDSESGYARRPCDQGHLPGPSVPGRLPPAAALPPAAMANTAGIFLVAGERRRMSETAK